MKIKELATVFDSMFPKESQESFDNCGLIVGNPDHECTGIITCLDVVPAIIEEAIKKGCNMIVSHHPLIFKGVKALLDNSFNNKIIMSAVKNDISIYAAHTSLDNRFHKSLSLSLAQSVGLENIEPLRKSQSSSSGIAMGAGAIGNLHEPQYAIDFLYAMRSRMKITCPIRYNKVGTNVLIKRIAVCGGAGAFLLDTAKKEGADMYITGDISYHPFLEEHDIYLVDMGHYDSEKHATKVLASLIREMCETFSKGVVSSAGSIESAEEKSPIISLNPSAVLETEVEHVAIGFCF